MEEQLVSQEVVDALNAPPAPPPETPNKKNLGTGAG